MEQEQVKRLIEAVAQSVIANTEVLTELDQAIGDGDHGLNMKRGFEAVLADLEAISAKPLPEAVKTVGTTMVMKVGGASGPLYGTLFMAFAKTLPEQPTLSDAASAFGQAIDAVKARGKSDVGQKTMLDVLAPAQAELAKGGDDLGARVKSAARDAAEATVPMKAIRGRASFLGERSIGHMDPGACSSAIIIACIVDILEQQPS